LMMAQQTEDGGYIVVGNTKSYGFGSWDVWLIKTDSEGQEEWNQTFGEEGGNEQGYSIQQTNDGGYIIIGRSSYYESGILLIKADSQGQEEWIQTLDTAYTSEAYSIQQTEDGGYILTGTRIGNGYRDADVLLIKTDSQGIEQWNKTFGISDTEYGNSVQQTSDGGYILTGPHSSDGTGNRDVWLIKTDSQGNKEWNQTFDESDSDCGKSVQQTSDGGYIITGKNILQPMILQIMMSY